jgi:CBS domain containing-hemolysin-like protein
MQPAQYFPETQKVEDILFSMQKSGIHMGIVVDEYGGAVGILTLEDLVEEIIGEIGDEYDADAQLYKELSEGRYLIQARMEIDAINERLKLNLPPGQYETLAGFLLQQFNCIPDEGDELYFKHLKFVVRQASDRVIRTVEVTRVEE